MIDVISDSKSQRNTCEITLYSNHSFLLDCMDALEQLYATVFSQPYNCAILDNGSCRSDHTFHFSVSSRADALCDSAALRYKGKTDHLVYFWWCLRNT